MYSTKVAHDTSYLAQCGCGGPKVVIASSLRHLPAKSWKEKHFEPHKKELQRRKASLEFHILCHRPSQPKRKIRACDDAVWCIFYDPCSIPKQRRGRLWFEFQRQQGNNKSKSCLPAMDSMLHSMMNEKSRTR